VTLQPGYYDDVTNLNALTRTGGGNCFIHMKPGTYYFDFHNNSADPLFDGDIAGSAGNVWNVDSGKIVGGTLTSSSTVPGRCVNPIDDVSAEDDERAAVLTVGCPLVRDTRRAMKKRLAVDDRQLLR